MFFLKRVIAGRAAIQTTNERSLMQEAAVTLYQRFLSENKLAEKNIISLHFSLTADLTAANPATLLRSAGYLSDTPLFCSVEPDIHGSPGQLIRMLFYYYGTKKAVPVYLGGAKKLRPDIFPHE